MARELPVWLARPFCCQIEINPMRHGESFVSSGLCQSTCLEVQRVIYGIVLSSQYDICQYDVISEIFELRMAMQMWLHKPTSEILVSFRRTLNACSVSFFLKVVCVYVGGVNPMTLSQNSCHNLNGQTSLTPNNKHTSQ